MYSSTTADGTAGPRGSEHLKLTATQVSEDIVALLREGDLVDGVSDVASLQQVAGIFTGLSAIRKAFHVVEQPVNHIRTWGQRFLREEMCNTSTRARCSISFIWADETIDKFSPENNLWNEEFQTYQ